MSCLDKRTLGPVLGINVDHVATLREARGTPYPSPLEAALLAEEGGADGITVHLREDRRHIQEEDVWAIKIKQRTRLNLEMAMTEEMLAFAEKLKPVHVCIVPEKRHELTTEGGFNVLAVQEAVTLACRRLKKAGIIVSLFIDPEFAQIKAAKACGVPVIELHTGAYANAESPPETQRELDKIKQSVRQGLECGLQVNAGHGLHYQNVQAIAQIPGITELNIGHSIIARALFVGISQAVREMCQAIRG